MPELMVNNGKMAPRSGDQPEIPNAIWSRVRSFLLDKRSGSVTLNVKDGHILSARVEEYVTITRAQVRTRTEVRT